MDNHENQKNDGTVLTEQSQQTEHHIQEGVEEYSNCYDTWGMPAYINRPYYELKIWVPPELSELKEFYVQARNKHNETVMRVIAGNEFNCDAGFDLICPNMVCAVAGETTKMNHRIRCSMSKVEHNIVRVGMIDGEFGVLPTVPAAPVGYYLYPRSSTGTKTPLRLANSVGIIDSGYRGDIIAAFDNWKRDDYVVDKGHRVVQLCPPDLSYPIYVLLVDDLQTLGETTRGTGGFGSTGV